MSSNFIRIVTFFLIVAAQGYGQDWRCATIVSDADFVPGAEAITIDKAGGVHCAFVEQATEDVVSLKYALRPRPNAAWEVETIQTAGAVDFFRLSIAADREGIPYVAVQFDLGSGTFGNLRILSLKDDDWVEHWRTTDISLEAEAGVDLKYHADTHRMHAAYTGTNGSLRLASQSQNGVWTKVVVNPSDDSGYHPSLLPPGGFGSFGKIAHYDRASGDLLFTEQKFVGAFPNLELSWLTSTVSSVADSGRKCVLRRLPEGKFGIGYQRRIGNNHGVFFAESTSPALWKISAVQTGSSTAKYGEFLSLTLDAKGNPQMAYSETRTNTSRDPLNLSRLYPSVGWDFSEVEVFESSDYSGLVSATNAAGAPVILARVGRSLCTYFSVSQTWAVGSPMDDLPNPAAELSEPTIAVDSEGIKYLAFCAQSNGLQEYKVYLGRDGSGSDGFRQIDVSTEPCLDLKLVQGKGNTQYLFLLKENSLTEFTITEDSITSRSVGSGGGHRVDETIDAQLGANGILHVCYRNAAGELEYARRSINDSSWDYPEIPDPAGSLGLALAVRADGEVAISGWSGLDDGRVILTRFPLGASAESFVMAADTESEIKTDLLYSSAMEPVVFWSDGGKLHLKSVGTPETTINFFPSSAAISVVKNRDGSYMIMHTNAGVASRRVETVIYYPDTNLSVRRRNLDFGKNIIPNDDRLDVIVDQFGFPWVGLECLIDGEKRILSASPADAIDDDHDQVPLLWENAFCLNPTADSRGLLPNSTVEHRSDERVHYWFYYRTPFNRATGLPRTSIGEFIYEREFSVDFENWKDIGGILDQTGIEIGDLPFFWGSEPVLVSPGVVRDSMGFAVNQADIPSVKSFFGRMNVRRVLPIAN